MSRAKVELKQEIKDALEEFPMTTHGVSKYVNCHYNTAKNHLQTLESLSVVERFTNNEKEYWRIAE